MTVYVSRFVSTVPVASLVVAELACLLLSVFVHEVCMQTCDNDVHEVRRSAQDVFSHLLNPCMPTQGCLSLSKCPGTSHDVSTGDRCRCTCNNPQKTFDFVHCVNMQGFESSSDSDCSIRLEMSQPPQQVPIRKLPDGDTGYINTTRLLWKNNSMIIPDSVEVDSAEYFRQDQEWELLSQYVGQDHKFVIEKETRNDTNIFYIKYHSTGEQSIKRCFDGLIIKLTLQLQRPNNMRTDCVIFKLAGQLKYNDSGILPCQGLPTQNTGSSNGEMDEMNRSPIAAIVGGVCAAAVIFIIGGVILFILWRRKFRPSLSKKNRNQRVTMSSLQNGHPHPTEGTVDNEIYASDDAGIVDNVIYEGGMGADGVFSNPGYADKTPQFKPRMDAPGAFVQPNPGATDKTPTPQRNIIIDEPQYAQIVDDQYADPQKVRDRKDKKNKKKAARDENYSDLKGQHERQPGENNSNSNQVYQGLNKGTDYQSLRGPREHHQVRPSQVPKTSQDGHDYTSLTPGSSKPSAGTLWKEADYTVLEGPDSPGEETAAGPDYTTLDGPDSPGDESTSVPDYTVLDGPDSPGD
ncbi:uncharacterized protein LOC144871370 isoform X2 [Branchiostoma floridae x Branchiostoma japonicum]